MSSTHFEERINLQDLLHSSASEFVDHTETIRRLKHSSHIRRDVEKLHYEIHNSADLIAMTRPEERLGPCSLITPFLHENYTDLFFKVVRDELNLDLFRALLDVLEKIEQGSHDQHSASVQIGTLLRDLYVDSNRRMSQHLDEMNGASEGADSFRQPARSMSYLEYKSRRRQIESKLAMA